jgi:hypothetical protein
VLLTHKTVSHGDRSAVHTQQIRFRRPSHRLIGEAFDAACKDLCDAGQPIVVQEVIAKRIIKAAMKGERDPARLRKAGLAALGYDREGI